MKVKLVTGRVGDRFAQSAGDVIDVDDATARRMLEAGQCVEVETDQRNKAGK